MHQIIGSRFANRTLPWGPLSHPLPLAQCHGAQDALRYADLDYQVTKVPIYAMQADIGQLPIENTFATIKHPVASDQEPEVLGLVGPHYTILDNMVLAEALDNSGIADRFPVHSVGSMANGSKIFICLNMGPTTMANEPYDQYLLIITGHDGATATTICYTPTRIDCTNALLRGVSSATAVLTLTHSRHINTLLTAATQRSIPETALSLQETMTRKLQQMTTVRLDTPQVTRVLLKVFPLPRKPAPYKMIPHMDEALQRQHAEALQRGYTNALERRNALCASAMDLYTRFNTQYPEHRETPYALYNVLVELAEHREGPSAEDQEDRVAVSSMVGSREREMGRAWQALETIVQYS